MNWRLTISFFFLLLFAACHKEYSCEGCLPGNTVPPGPPSPPNPPAPVIAELNCINGSFSSAAFAATPYLGQYNLSYSGGNGAPYKADTIASAGVTGLTAILHTGTLANGNGNLIFTISGTPATTGNAIFSISFAGKSCTALLRVDPDTVVISWLMKVPIAAEKERSLVVLSNGTVKAWGNNQFGQLGDGTTIDRHIPVDINTLSSIAAVAAGAYHSLALGNNGKVWTWGKNDYGELGDGTQTENHIPRQVSGLSNIISIAAGFDYSIALRNDGTVWAWGNNMWGVLGNGNYTTQLRPVQVINLSDIIAIAAGTEHCLALKNDGTVWAWGWNANGCLGDNSNIAKRSTPAPIPALSGVKAIAANGSIHSLALKNDGTVWAWGDNFYGQLGDGTLIGKSAPMQLSSLDNITAIGTGERHSFAIRNDGTLWAWGWNGNGQLGVDLNFSSYQSTPVSVPALLGTKRITGGSFHSLVQKTSGSIFTMGNNVYGQLGDGTNVINRYAPMIVPGL